VEEDVQWVFVSGLQVRDGKLLVRNEHGKSYRLDLKTGRVEGFVRSWFLWVPGGCFLVVVALFTWVRRRGAQPNGTANRSQPIRSEPNGTSAAAGSSR